jgi:hypothetical protein
MKGGASRRRWRERSHNSHFQPKRTIFCTTAPTSATSSTKRSGYSSGRRSAKVGTTLASAWRARVYDTSDRTVTGVDESQNGKLICAGSMCSKRVFNTQTIVRSPPHLQPLRKLPVRQPAAALRHRPRDQRLPRALPQPDALLPHDAPHQLPRLRGGDLGFTVDLAAVAPAFQGRWRRWELCAAESGGAAAARAGDAAGLSPRWPAAARSAAAAAAAL